MDNYSENLEKHLIELIKEKEESDRRLLKIEVVMGLCSLLPFAAGITFALLSSFDEWIKVALIFGSMVPFLIAVPFLLRIEQKAGYYECGHCKHRHIPRYSSVFLAPHVNRTRYLRCPRCEKLTWQKKVISKEEMGIKND